MNLNEYISSGILELYVYGALPEEESIEVTKELKKHPEILKEVEEIEDALTQLSTAAAPYNPEALFSRKFQIRIIRELLIILRNRRKITWCFTLVGQHQLRC